MSTILLNEFLTRFVTGFVAWLVILVMFSLFSDAESMLFKTSRTSSAFESPLQSSFVQRITSLRSTPENLESLSVIVLR